MLIAEPFLNQQSPFTLGKYQYNLEVDHGYKTDEAG
jgi:hypothetical protein